MKKQHLMLQPLGWEAIVFLDENNSNLILFKRIEDQEWYQAMYRYDTKKLIANTTASKWVLEQNRYIILSVLFAMIQEDAICKQIRQTEEFEQGRINEEEIKQYFIRYSNHFQTQEPREEY